MSRQGTRVGGGVPFDWAVRVRVLRGEWPGRAVGAVEGAVGEEERVVV